MRAATIKELQRQLKAKGYELDVNPSRKYWTIRQPNWNRPIRLIRMGAEYSKEAILQKLIENQSKQRLGMRSLQATDKKKMFAEDEKTKTQDQRPARAVPALLLSSGRIPKKTKPRTCDYLYRDDLFKLNNITAEARLLCTNQIESTEELFSYQEKLESEVKELCVQRKQLYNETRRVGLTAEENRILQNSGRP